MTESWNRNAHLRVGAAAAAVFVVLLLVGAARGEGRLEPGAPASATPTPGTADPESRADPRGRFGDPRGGRIPDQGDGLPGGAVPLPDEGGGGVPAPGGVVPMPDESESIPAPAPDGSQLAPESGGTLPAPEPGGTIPAPGADSGATT